LGSGTLTVEFDDVSPGNFEDIAGIFVVTRNLKEMDNEVGLVVAALAVVEPVARAFVLIQMFALDFVVMMVVVVVVEIAVLAWIDGVVEKIVVGRLVVMLIVAAAAAAAAVAVAVAVAVVHDFAIGVVAVVENGVGFELGFQDLKSCQKEENQVGNGIY